LAFIDRLPRGHTLSFGTGEKQTPATGTHASRAMPLVRPLSLKGAAMLRLVLLVLYLIAAASQLDGGGGWDPDGLAVPPLPPQTDGGGGWDPNG